MTDIKTVNVNGTEYGITTGGEMPLYFYSGSGGCGAPEFDNYGAGSDEEFSEGAYVYFYVRKTMTDDVPSYDIVALCTQREYSRSDPFGYVEDYVRATDNSATTALPTQRIDSVAVNGTDYVISMGGELPISVYAGCDNSNQPYFSTYEPGENETFAAIYPEFFVRRVMVNGSYEYDIVMLLGYDEYTPLDELPYRRNWT